MFNYEVVDVQEKLFASEFGRGFDTKNWFCDLLIPGHSEFFPH
jgi:hypothetical protein